MNSRNKWIGKGVWDRDTVDLCVVSSLLIRHPVLGVERKVWIAVYGSSCWEGQGEWLDAALPGSALLIKSMKLINLWFHMVGCLRFLSLPSFSLSHSHSIFFSIPLPMEECVRKWGWCVLGYCEHWLWFYTSESSSFPSQSFSLGIISLFIITIFPISSIRPFLNAPFIQPAKHVRINEFRAARQRENEARSSLCACFPPYQPHYGSNSP